MEEVQDSQLLQPEEASGHPQLEDFEDPCAASTLNLLSSTQLVSLSDEDDLDIITESQPRLFDHKAAKTRAFDALNVRSWVDEAGSFAWKTYDVNIPTTGKERKFLLGGIESGLNSISILGTATLN